MGGGTAKMGLNYSLINGNCTKAGSDELGGKKATEEQSILHDEGAEEKVNGQGGEAVP